MIVLYLLARLSLAALHLLARRRVARLEKRYVRLAAEADSLLKESSLRAGNNRPDPFLVAKTQHALALKALKRDRVEDRYVSCQKASERFPAWRRGFAGFRGRLLPYLFGLVDVTAVGLALSRFQVTLTEARSLVGL